MSEDLRKALPFCLIFAAVFCACYGGAAWWTARYDSLPAWDFPFEHRLPFVPELSVVYLTITPALLLAPFLLRRRSEVALFAATLTFETLIATLCFLLFPQSTAFARPAVTGWGRVPFEIADVMNLRYNEFPSLHVAFAFTAAWAYRRFAWKVWAVLVAVSTLLIREHHLADIVGGIALAAMVMALVRRERVWVELCCLYQCALFSRRHVRYLVIFLAIYVPSLLAWRRYRAVRTGFCAAQWIDDLLDGDRPSSREPLEIIDALISEMESDSFSPQPLSRLTRAFFLDLDSEGRRAFIALVRSMRIDRERVLRQEIWPAEELDAHHRRTFSLSVDLLLRTTGCTARAAEVPSLVDALAWCSVFRDLDEDLRKGLVNIPRGVDVSDWAHRELAKAMLALDRSVAEIAALDDARARRILGIFRSSVAKYTRRGAQVLLPSPESVSASPSPSNRAA